MIGFHFTFTNKARIAIGIYVIINIGNASNKRNDLEGLQYIFLYSVIRTKNPRAQKLAYALIRSGHTRVRISIVKAVESNPTFAAVSRATEVQPARNICPGARVISESK